MRTPSITWNGVPVVIDFTGFGYCAYLDGQEEVGTWRYGHAPLVAVGELLQWLYDMEVS